MKKIVLIFAGLLASTNLFAGSFSCPVQSIQYDGTSPKIGGWVAGTTEDIIPKGTYYLAAALSSSTNPVLAGCIYSLDGRVDDNGDPERPGGIWLLGSMSVAGIGQWTVRQTREGHDLLCRGTNCTFKTF